MLADLAASPDPRLLVGADTADDAGAFQLRDDLVLLQTADVISPVGDDPFVYGQVAAANSLSDVYAMGGRPVTALNLAFFPAKAPRDVQAEILRGAWEKCREAEVSIVGGHTVDDDDVKFGLAVSGTCKPEELLRNAGARPGDRLVLTKPVGTGFMMAARLKGWIDDDELRACHEWMAALNADAARLAVEHGAHGATDVTGFGLGGHGWEMAKASGVRLRFDLEAVPAYPRWRELVAKGARTGITGNNLDRVGCHLADPDGITDEHRQLLADPQTSGGLLVALPEDRAVAYRDALRGLGNDAVAVVGEVIEGEPALDVARS